MYLPKHFEQHDRALTLEVMRAHSFATMVSVDDAGAPFATHLPIIVSEIGTGDAAKIVLEGHVAKPNPHWKYLAARPDVLVMFQGPNAYQSPRVYPDLMRVPSWNYVAVHATGRARLIEDARGKDALLKRVNDVVASAKVLLTMGASWISHCSVVLLFVKWRWVLGWVGAKDAFPISLSYYRD